MNILYNYFWPQEKTEQQHSLPKKFIITSDDLTKVNLTPQKNIIPGPSRNMPVLDTFELSIYNKAQLNEILSIKLKPTKINEKPSHYQSRHPVVKQLNEKFGIMGIQSI